MISVGGYVLAVFDSGGGEQGGGVLDIGLVFRWVCCVDLSEELESFCCLSGVKTEWEKERGT